MAKNSLPSVDDVKVVTNVKVSGDSLELQSKSLGEIASEGYIPRNVDVRMNRSQARILRDKLRQLQDAGAKTADGRFVDSRSQAVRWILENEVVL
jgi:hypothetical protein